jgi:hypothetical protein
MPTARPDALLLLLRAAVAGPKRETLGTMASRAGLSYATARRALDEATVAGWMRSADADIAPGRHLHWEVTEEGYRHLAALLAGRAG